MKKQKIFFMLLMTVMLVAASSVVNKAGALVNSVNLPREWEKLAEAKLNQGLNQYEINLSAENRAFSAVKIRSIQGGINLHRCTFYYSNGEKMTVEMRNDIPSGMDSRVIQLPPKKNKIVKVELWYDTKNYGDQKAVFELWGKA